LEATYNNIVTIEEKFDKDKDLISFGLIKNGSIVTNAGALLCDQGILHHSRVFCTRWKGKVKGSVDLDAIDDKEYSGSLISLLESAVTFVQNNSQKMWTIKGLTREEEADYPYRAVREVIVNALIHRDYQILGSEIHIDMYDDRMEVYSPGGMANGWRIQDLNLLRVPSIRRNPVISDIFGRIHFMDRKGSGIQRIMSAYDRCKCRPEFFSEATAFFVELPNMTYHRKNEKSAIKIGDKESAIKIGDKIIKTKTKRQLDKIMNNMKMGKLYTTAEIAEIVQLQVSRTRQLLKILVDSKVIEPLGNNRNRQYKKM
jgi:predicted HTH transcriptional regulator